MFVFIQPFGLSSPAGGPRILRSLLKETSYPFLSICTSPMSPPETIIGKEIHLPLRPNFYRLERSRLAKYLGLSLPLYSSSFKARLEKTLLQYGATAVHSIPHGLDFAYAFEVAKKLGIPYYLNVHDELDYNLKGHVELVESQNQLAHIWREATGRMVISEAMGEEYSRRYGGKSYTIVTDGLETLSSFEKRASSQSLRVYFMGSVHLSYKETFINFSRALDQFAKINPALKVSFVVRGELPFSLPKLQISIEKLPWGTEAEVQQDLDKVDFLYLPLPFNEEYQSFSRYSLSTKMVTYLGSGLPIIYHGPENAAACQILKKHNAAILLTSIDPNIISKSLISIKNMSPKLVENSLHLAKEQFLLSDVRDRFWNVISSHSESDIDMVT
jgi:hypothetical protein